MRKRQRGNAKWRVMYGLLLVAMMCCGPAGAQDPQNPQELLARTEETLQKFERGQYVASVSVRRKGEEFPEETQVREARWEVRHDGDRWRLVCDGESTARQRGKTFQDKRKIEYVFSPEGSLLVDLDPKTRDVTAVIARKRLNEESRRMVFMEDDFMWVYGHLQGNGLKSYLPAALRESSLTARASDLAGTSTWLVEGKGPYGTYQVWLDPKEGYLPRRVELRKTGSDLFGKKPVSAIAGLHQVTVTIAVQRFEHVDQVPIMAEFSIEHKQEYADHEVMVRSMSKLSKISLSGDLASPNAFQVAAKIPNGTPVQVDDALHLDYIWKDGQIVNVVDSELLSQLGGHGFLGGFGLGRFWLVAVNLLVFSAGLCVWIWRRRGMAPHG